MPSSRLFPGSYFPLKKSCIEIHAQLEAKLRLQIERLNLVWGGGKKTPTAGQPPSRGEIQPSRR